jgi:hypothetical protein
LVVKWASFAHASGYRVIKACVVNAGDTASGPTKVAFYGLHDAGGAKAADLWCAGDVPGLKSGDETVVYLGQLGSFAEKTLFVAYVDCPVVGKELGQVAERRLGPQGTTRPVAEVNNVLICPVDPGALPRTIYNPGACSGGF